MKRIDVKPDPDGAALPVEARLARIDAEITALTDTLHRDSRATRGPDGKVVPEGPGILAERLALKAKVRELKRARAALREEQAAERPVRSLAEIDAERESVMATEAEVRARLRELAVEREVAVLLERQPAELSAAERRAAAIRARR